MTTQDIMHRIGQYSSWFYYRQWQDWELLLIAAIGSFVLTLMVIRRRKTADAVSCVPEHWPVIGAKLIDRRRRRFVMHSWKRYSLISLLVVLPLFALSLALLYPYWISKEPAPKIVSVDSAVVPVFAAGLGSAAEVEKAVEPKVDPFTLKYEKYYNKYRNKYAVLAFGNEFVELPGFDLQNENRWYVRGQEEGASPLPEWITGQYGSIPPRRIIQILGPEEMLVAGLISEGGRLVRFRGWPTAGLRNGQVWPFDPYQPDQDKETEPLEVAVAGTYTYRTLIGDSTTVPIVVPLKLFRKGITTEQFRNLLITKKELPQDLLRLKSELIEYEAARSDEKRPAIKQAGL